MYGNTKFTPRAKWIEHLQRKGGFDQTSNWGILSLSGRQTHVFVHPLALEQPATQNLTPVTLTLHTCSNYHGARITIRLSLRVLKGRLHLFSQGPIIRISDEMTPTTNQEGERQRSCLRAKAKRSKGFGILVPIEESNLIKPNHRMGDHTTRAPSQAHLPSCWWCSNPSRCSRSSPGRRWWRWW